MEESEKKKRGRTPQYLLRIGHAPLPCPRKGAIFSFFVLSLSPAYNPGTLDTAVSMVNAVEGGDAEGGITVLENYFFIKLVDTKYTTL